MPEEFDQFAQDYKSVLDQSLKLGGETGDYFAEYKALYTARRLGNNFSGKILDYGCGIGLLAQVLLKHLPQAVIHGYDVSALCLEQVPSHLKDQGLYTSDVNSLSKDYDLIVIANVFHHIVPALRLDVIIKLKGLLKATGRIMIFEHNPLNPLTCKIVRESPLDKVVVLLSGRETVSYLKNAGFEVRTLDYIVFFPKFLSALRWAEPFLCWLPVGAQYVIIARLKTYAKD
jgi:2-polyprenyl-3-methyl-5-hydroxy-6-metoxy-1,4-benzoquinol methylase